MFPPGLKFTPEGKLSGIPEARGTYVFTIWATYTLNNGGPELSYVTGYRDVTLNILDTPDVVFDFQPSKTAASWGAVRDGRDRIKYIVVGDRSVSVRHIALRGSDINFSEIDKGGY